MPPRYAYWTIIAGGLPTAFRAAHREELLPTFRRIQAKHPDAVMQYFARGRLWESPEAARRAAEAQRSAQRGRSDARGRDWRPGGAHRDPRQTFKDAKKERNLRWRQARFERRRAAEGEPPAREPGRRPPREKPHGDPLRQPAGRPFQRNRSAMERTPGSARQQKPGIPRAEKTGGASRGHKPDGGTRRRAGREGPPRGRRRR